MPSKTVVDVHTHMYPPPYVDLLKARNSVPYIREFPDAPNNWRLIILPGEDDPSTPSTSRGRPIGPAYWDVDEKIKFMDLHGIDTSVVSLANPWLDWVTDEEQAIEYANMTNNCFDELCSRYPSRLFAFGALPMKASVPAIQAEVRRLKQLKWMRGVIMGTTGAGRGLDDPDFEPVWRTIADTNTMVFLHPHYGLPSDLYGPQNNKYGHVLALALGFPLETTIAITRMILSGIFTRVPNLKILLAHSGGTLPFLAGRIQSCIEHDAHFNSKDAESKINVWDVLNKNIYLDAVIYSKVGLKAAMEATPSGRVMFGKMAFLAKRW
jgi:aminocarboxymuconate-semialdehyde decarboxylase